jgi:hypothetical protein
MARHPKMSKSDQVIARAKRSFEQAVIRGANNLLIASANPDDKMLRTHATDAIRTLLRLAGATATSGRVAHLQSRLADVEGAINADHPDQPTTCPIATRDH